MRELRPPDSRRSYSFIELLDPNVPPDLFPHTPHCCLIAIVDPDLAIQLKEPLSNALVSSGCNWVSCHGLDAADWEETIDWRNVDVTLDLPPKKDFTIPTTSHPDQPLEDVAVMFGQLRGDEYARGLIISIGPGSESFRTIESVLSSTSC